MTSFEPENVFKFVLAWARLAREKQNILTPQDVYILSHKHSSQPIRARVLNLYKFSYCMIANLYRPKTLSLMQFLII